MSPTRAITVSVAGFAIRIAVPAEPPLGWRFWTFAGFPGDPVEPRPYGGSRGIPLASVETPRGDRWLVAMEADGSAQLFTTHELFPCADQDGAPAFGRSWLDRHADQPSLFQE